MTKKITRYSLVIIFIVGIFLFKTEVSQAANQISKVDFENNLTDSLGYIHAYEYWYNHPSNPDHIVTYVPGHTGLAAWSTHNLDDSGGDLNIAFPSSPFPATDELYIKYWVKFDANYSNCVGNTYYNTKQLWFDGGSLGHTEIAFTSFSDTGVGLVWQGGSGTPIGSDWFGASYTRGDWMKVEIYMKLSSGTSHSNPDGHFVMAINNEIVSDRNNIITGHYNGAALDRSPALKATCDSADGHGGWAIDDYEVWDGLPPFAFMSSSISTTPPSTICTESWSCTSWSAWSTCTNNSQSQTKTCTDANSCGTTTSKPITTQTQSCTTSQTVSTKLAINDRVKTTTTLNVRATPSITGTLLGSQVLGAFGTIIGGPVSSDGYWWWQVNYDNAPDGWSVEQYLEKYLTTSSATCTESWSCSVWSAWSACNNSSQTQTRACTDVNSCGTTTSKPTTTGSQACTSATVSGSSLLFQENFDDQEVDSRLIVYGPNWSVLSPPDYNLNAVGRNGTGYSFSSGNVNSAHLVWKNNIPSPWPSDEMHVSFWMRYPNFTSTDTFENFKLFYPHWNGVQSYVHYTMMNDGTIYYSAKGNGTMIELSKYIGTPNMTDGKWHHYEFYIKFSTGISKFWYDGTLKLDADYADGVWTPNNVYYVAAPSIDAEETGTFSRQVDDWEVRDGMPSSSAINPTPTPTTCTSFTYSSWNTCQSNNTQTRTVITSSPTGCTGGSPVTTQSCTITPTVSTKLAINDNVKTTTTLNVRATPSITGTLLGSQVLGAFGTIIGGPVSSDGYWWWQVNYDSAPDGWSAENWLEKYTITSPVTCTNFTYSTFGTCQSNGTQSRTIISSTPTGCVGGSPVLTQSCIYTPPVCIEAWTCSSWSAWGVCSNNSQTQTRTCTDANSCGTTATKPITTGTQTCALSGIYQCNDGIDNDSDGKIDYPIDPGCASAEDNDEYDSAWVDTIAPSAPARLQATSISSSQINLTWVSATDDLGVAGYHIYRCAGTSCTPTNSLTTTITNFYSDTALIPNTNYTYSVKAFDMAGKLGAYSNTATVGGGITDTVPPVISSLIPTGILPAGTTSTILSVTTNETAICKYSTVANTAYDSMTGTMTASGDTHSAIISRLSNGNHNYYIKCRDTVGNTNTTDANISFSIATSTTDQTPIVNPVGTKLIDGLTCSQYFNATLSYGMENEQVKKLQEILSLDKKIYPKGINSGYYGNLTIKAVQRYQCKYDVVCSGTEATTGYGVFGPMTRKVFCDVYNQ